MSCVTNVVILTKLGEMRAWNDETCPAIEHVNEWLKANQGGEIVGSGRNVR